MRESPDSLEIGSENGASRRDESQMSPVSGHELVALPTLELTDGFGILVSLGFAFVLVLIVMPSLIRKMRAGGMVGRDVNKPAKAEVAELGGIAALFAFSVSLSLVVGLQKIIGNVAEPPFLAAIAVFFMAGMIGLIDDISNMRQRLKAIILAFAALPLMLVHLGPEVIQLPFGFAISFTGSMYLLYWIVLVPIGVTGLANAVNMSAGYNGLESGQVAIVTSSLLLIGYLRNIPAYSLLILAALVGCALGLFYFNRYPAKVFIGDVGTMGLGAVIAAAVILGHIEFYGIVAIAPAFYEAGSTLYYGLTGKNGDRRAACHNPVLLPDGRLSPAKGAGRYTLANLVLSKRPMTERNLVRVLLAVYALCGAAAIALSVI